MGVMKIEVDYIPSAINIMVNKHDCDSFASGFLSTCLRCFKNTSIEDVHNPNKNCAWCGR